MNEEQIITAAMQFLQRTTLQGTEVPLYVAVSNYLTEKHAAAVEAAKKAAEANTPKTNTPGD